MYRTLLLAALTLPAAACASAQAKAPIEPVSLEVPAVPPRVVETVVIDPPPAPPPEEPIQAPAPRDRTEVTASEPRRPETRTGSQARAGAGPA